MAEYIEREVLFKKALEEKRFVFQTENLLNNELVVKTVYKDFAEFVNSIPAADVVPVVHGRWDRKDHYLHGHYITTTCICSVCGSCPTMEYRFCPYCGARMDGE